MDRTPVARDDRAARRSASDPVDWVDLHGDAMYRFAILRVREPDAAEEVVQEALVSALSARKEFSERSSERTWLIGILKHKLIDHFRRNAAALRREAGDEGDAAADAVFTDRGLWKAGSRRWSGAPVGNLEKVEFWSALNACVSLLPSCMADAFRLRELEQMSGDEVCSVLGISSNNLWALLHRARLRLRQCLENNWFGKKERRAR